MIEALSQTPVKLTGKREAIAKKTYIRPSNYPRPPSTRRWPSAKRVGIVDDRTGHDAASIAAVHESAFGTKRTFDSLR
jgi:hypothetical protein